MILVAGATGSLGGRIARGLLEDGIPVRALVRPQSDAAGLAAAGADIARGSLTDVASLEAACAGVSAVITTASATRRTDDSIDNVDRAGTINLVNAAQRCGVGHVVMVSTGGASPQSPNPVFQAKGKAEAHLRSSGLRHTILQPAPFMDVWFRMLIEMPILSGQPVTLVGESRRRHSFIAEQDVAAFARAAVRNDGDSDTVLLGGPDGVTFRDAVRAYEEAIGRAIEVRSVAPGEPLPGLPAHVSALAASFESFDNIVPMDELAARYEVALTSIRRFAAWRAPVLAASR